MTSWACGKAVTVVLVNDSASVIVIDDEDRSFTCRPRELVSYVPRRRQHDFLIRAGQSVFAYDLQPMPESFLDRKGKKRVVFVFREDHKIYLLKPTDRPLEEAIGRQPPGYPLSPKRGRS